MNKKLYTIIVILLVVFSAAYIFTPLDFYVRKYANRLLSYNPKPADARINEKVTSYDWTLKGLDGEIINLKQHKGQVLFINFWATWCPPCIKEMPGLQNLYNDYGDKITFLFIARDKEKRVEAFLVKKEYELPVYFENGLTPKTLYHPSLPTTYIIDKESNIRVAKNGEADWNSESIRTLLEKLLKE